MLSFHSASSYDSHRKDATYWRLGLRTIQRRHRAILEPHLRSFPDLASEWDIKSNQDWDEYLELPISSLPSGQSPVFLIGTKPSRSVQKLNGNLKRNSIESNDNSIDDTHLSGENRLQRPGVGESTGAIVVKFFVPSASHPSSYPEIAAYKLIESLALARPGVTDGIIHQESALFVYRHTPSILVHDRLYDPSHSDTSDFNPHVKALVWPYLIQPFVHGEDLSKTFPEGSSPSILAETAVFLGKYLRHLHQIELGVSPQAQSNPLYEGNWKGFEKFLIKRRQTVTKRRPIASFGLSYKLQLELDDYIPRDVRSLCEPSQESFQLTSPRLLHGDMNENNVYLLDGKPYAVIDFGDCRMGDPHYDFVSVFVSSLRCHKGLLILCLQEYYQVEDFDELTEKVGGWQSFARIMMGYTLLHEQEMMRTVFHNRPDLRNIDQLELLEQALWNLGES